jgi:peptidoglycan/LPS O-acetylase OafA/YrhL
MVILTIAYLFLAGICSLIAEKRGRRGGPFFLKIVGGTAALLLVAFWALAGSADIAVGMAVVAYGCLALAFLLAIFNPGAKELAAANGEHGAYKKCPYCAEPVRREAVKCKHCQSELINTMQ